MAKAALSNDAEQPHQYPQPFAAERAMAEQAIAPNADRQEQCQRAKPQQLHHQIGSNRAGAAEQIVHAARRWRG